MTSFIWNNVAIKGISDSETQPLLPFRTMVRTVSGNFVRLAFTSYAFLRGSQMEEYKIWSGTRWFCIKVNSWCMMKLGREKKIWSFLHSLFFPGCGLLGVVHQFSFFKLTLTTPVATFVFQPPFFFFGSYRQDLFQVKLKTPAILSIHYIL